MGKGINKPVGAHEPEPVSLSELIHQHVRAAIETAVYEELRAALGTIPSERSEVRCAYRNGTKARTMLTRPADAAILLRFSLVTSRQIRLRRIDGWHKIAAVLRQHTEVAA